MTLATAEQLMALTIADRSCSVGRELLPCNYQLSKSIVHEIKFGDIAVM